MASQLPKVSVEMDTETAKANLKPGKEVAYLAKCIDTLLQEDCKDPSVLEILAPFLGQKLMENKVIDYSVEPGVDITDHYFVLWEPFLRAKSALLIGTIAEKCENLPDCTKLVDTLVGIFTSAQSEEIEIAFSFFAITHIGLRQPEAVVPHFAKMAKYATTLISIAAAPPKAFGLFHSIPFRTEAFESFLNLCQTKGIFENPDNVNRFVAAGLPVSLLQIALSAQCFVEKHPEMQWKLLSVFVRLLTEYPNGYQLIDLDRLPRENFNDCCTLMRFAVVNHDKVGALRSEIDSVKEADRTGPAFQALVKKYQGK